MPRWPDISIMSNPSQVYGLVQIYTGWSARLQESIPACVNLSTRQIKLLEYVSRDSYDLSNSDIRFRVYRTNTSVEVDDGETSEFQIDHEDLEVIEQAWSKVKVKLLREKLSRPLPSRPGPSKSSRPKM